MKNSILIFDVEKSSGIHLIIRPGAIGDFVLSLPALECLRGSYTEVWAASQNLPLARFAERARSIASTGLDLLGLPDTAPPAHLVETLGRFEQILSWYGANRAEFRAAAAGLPFHFFDALPPEGWRRPAVDFYLDQARSLGFSPEEARPRIPCHRPRSDFAVIHPFSGSRRKNWPLERFQELARRLSGRLPVTWCAGPEEPLRDAVRIENLYDLAQWLGTARLFIGNDSGIAHLAAAAGTPVVAVFGPTDPAVWAPRGEPVEVVAGRLEEIEATQVFAACMRVLDSTP
ncbi:MAG: glycosyltransferase family 9 protein [Acidobacteria bacterium]|nr:glycosyltransferase family 9 protein [Acidobacteriota bacterium]